MWQQGVLLYEEGIAVVWANNAKKMTKEIIKFYFRCLWG